MGNIFDWLQSTLILHDLLKYRTFTRDVVCMF